MKPRSRNPGLSLALLLGPFSAGVALGARSLPRSPCRPACEHRGLCLPRGQLRPPGSTWAGARDVGLTPRTGLEGWGCFCRDPWAGATCAERLEREGGPQLGRSGGGVQESLPRRVQPEITVAAPGVGGRQAEQQLAAKRRRLEVRLQTLQQGLEQIKEAAKTDPGYRFRLVFYRALCASLPCPLGLRLRNFRVVDAVGPAVHLDVVPGPGSAPLEAIRLEVERQLADAASPLHRAGGRLLDVSSTQLGLWFTKSPAAAWKPQSAQDALAALAVQQQLREGNSSDPRNSQTPEALNSQTREALRIPDKINETEVIGITGARMNTADDLAAFLSAVGLNTAIILVSLVLLSILRRVVPVVYEDKQAISSSSFFGWMEECNSMGTQEVMNKAGLDAAMLVEFSNLSMRILKVIGLPLVLVMCPLHYFCGGNAAGDDKLSWISMGNVEKGSWLCWVHAFLVWYVVIVTQRVIFSSMRRDFIPRRFRFLKDMPEPRSTTVLVQKLPETMCKEHLLRKYFEESVFGRHVVRAVYFVKHTQELEVQMKNLKRAKEVADIGRRSASLNPERLQRLEKLEREVESEVERLRQELRESDDVNSRYAFVTFESRRDAAIALKLFSPDDMEEIVVTIPPDPSDVIWGDFLVDPNLRACREMLGYGLIAAVVIFFLPVVVYIARIASLDNVKDKAPIFENLVMNYPKLSTLWDGLVGSLSLSISMSTIPTILMLIFGGLFVCRAQNEMQLYLQSTYYYFLVLYVLLVTAIGSSVIETATYLAQHPMEVFGILADKMPTRTHFYLSYLAVQWGTHALNITRYQNLLKFCILVLVYDRRTAKELSEPEDQDYYGMGSRNARFSLQLVICLVFCSLSPLMIIVGYVNFFFSRIYHIYLFVHSETKKADLGGIFWFKSLKHIQQGLFLYATLMTGVLMERAASLIPAGITFLCLTFSIYEYCYFLREFRWELLEFHELQGETARLPESVTYQQPELVSKPSPTGEPPAGGPGKPGQPKQAGARLLEAAQRQVEAVRSQLGLPTAPQQGSTTVMAR